VFYRFTWRRARGFELKRDTLGRSREIAPAFRPSRDRRLPFMGRATGVEARRTAPTRRLHRWRTYGERRDDRDHPPRAAQRLSGRPRAPRVENHVREMGLQQRFGRGAQQRHFLGFVLEKPTDIARSARSLPFPVHAPPSGPGAGERAATLGQFASRRAGQCIAAWETR
jgi:hypothetical protein